MLDSWPVHYAGLPKNGLLTLIQLMPPWCQPLHKSYVLGSLVPIISNGCNRSHNSIIASFSTETGPPLPCEPSRFNQILLPSSCSFCSTGIIICRTFLTSFTASLNLSFSSVPFWLFFLLLSLVKTLRRGMSIDYWVSV